MKQTDLLFFLPLIGLACLAGLTYFSVLPMDSHGVNWDNPSGNADDMFNDNNATVLSPRGLSASPKASREEKIGKIPNLSPMPSSLSSGGNSAAESRSLAQASSSDSTNIPSETSDTSATAVVSSVSSSVGEDVTPIDQTEASSASSTASNLGGSWSFELQDSSAKSVVLTLFQKENTVFGSGSLSADNSTLPIAASGLINGSKLNLDLITLETAGLYKMSLDANGDSASGDYSAYSTSSDPWKGTVAGTRSVPQS